MGSESLKEFVYTQSSMLCFESCPLRFKRKYIDGCKWRNMLNGEEKDRLDDGKLFHLLAQRYFLGIDSSEDIFNEYPHLFSWLQNLKNNFQLEADKIYLPEHNIRVKIGDNTLEANFDLLIISSTGIDIWDWKTGKYGNKAAINLKLSLQTMVYMYIAGEAGLNNTGQKVEKGSVHMNYWQPEEQKVLVHIDLTNALHNTFRAAIEEKISNINTYDYSNFDASLYDHTCKKCEFAWLCKKTNTMD